MRQPSGLTQGRPQGFPVLSLIAVIKAGILYKKPKDGKFMLCYKQRIIKLRQAEEPENFVLETAQSILPNETKYQQILENYKTWYSREPKLLSAINKLYRLYYELAKTTSSQTPKQMMR
ncbi:unnamed protein product [Rhizophagus irregularis]|nr:unnamed protein product [Rhizophagus irregularis]